MEVLCLVLSLVSLLVAIGSALFSLLRKRSSVSWEEYSEPLRDEVRAFKRQMTDEWENTHHKLRSIAGRIDRQKRTDKEGQREEEDGNGVGPAGPLTIADINREILRRKGVNLPGL